MAFLLRCYDMTQETSKRREDRTKFTEIGGDGGELVVEYYRSTASFPRQTFGILTLTLRTVGSQVSISCALGSLPTGPLY